MDLCGSIIPLPYIKIFDETLDTKHYKLYKFNKNDYVKKSEVLKPEIPTYNLFYYGKWQQPVENTYWMYNETLWAHATRYEYIFLLILFVIEIILKFFKDLTKFTYGIYI